MSAAAAVMAAPKKSQRKQDLFAIRALNFVHFFLTFTASIQHFASNWEYYADGSTLKIHYLNGVYILYVNTSTHTAILSKQKQNQHRSIEVAK